MPTALPATAAANAAHGDPLPCAATAPAVTSSASVSAGTPSSPNDKLTKMTAAAWRDSHASMSGARCTRGGVPSRCQPPRTNHAVLQALRIRKIERGGKAIVQTMDPLSKWAFAVLLNGLGEAGVKAVSLGAHHGYGVLLRIEQITGGALAIEQGALYPALYRLEHQGLLDAEWGTSDNNRRAKFYRLTAAGRRRLRAETERWHRTALAMNTALDAQEA